MVLAKTSKAAGRLAGQFRTRTAGKYYLALTLGQPPEKGRLSGCLLRNGSKTEPAGPEEGGTPAYLDWQIAARGELDGRQAAVWLIRLGTGFKHQIRAQLAAAGFPLAGDSLYGGRPGPDQRSLGLWAWKLKLVHPLDRQEIAFQARPAAVWPWSRWSGTPMLLDHDY
jgi:23S rRNA pseudouridine1911/1915/1917 synthase